MPQIIATPVTGATARGIRTAFVNTYTSMYKAQEARLREFVDMELPSDKLQEIYGYPTAAPHPRRWPRGENIPENVFDYVTYTVTNFDWGMKVPYHLNDVDDDQTRSALNMARQAGTNFGLLYERVVFQAILNTADPALLPAIVNAPDGAAIFSTTNGAGGNRFGIANGNLLTGNGVATPAAIEQDYFAALAQARQFQDGQGQPLFPSELIDGGVLIIAGAANERNFRKAFEQRITGQILQNVAAAENVALAGMSNIILDAGLKVRIWLTSRITDNDWTVIFTAVPMKPFGVQVRQPLREAIYDMSNSDRTRGTKEAAIQWDARFGLAINLPYQMVRINN